MENVVGREDKKGKQRLLNNKIRKEHRNFHCKFEGVVSNFEIYCSSFGVDNDCFRGEGRLL